MIEQDLPQPQRPLRQDTRLELRLEFTMTARAFLCVLAFLLLPACLDRPRGAATAEEAIAVTNDYWEENLPQVDLNHFAIETRNFGDRWRVTYNLREGGTGGPSIFDVDKRTGRIVHAEGGQ